MKPELPQDRMAEEAVLGGVLIDPSALSTIDLTAQDFYIVRHQMIWDAMRAVGNNLDYVSLTAELKDRNTLDEIGGLPYITGLINSTPTALNVHEHAQIVKDLAIRRRDIDIAHMIVKQSYNGGLDRAKVIEMLSDNHRVDGGAKHLREPLAQLINQVEERAKDPREIWGIPSGFYDLDRMIGGLQPEQTMMLAAPPGVGKSVLAMQIAKNVAQQGIGVAIYSFEMSAVRVLTRLISAESGVPTRAMNTGYMESHWDSFYATSGEFDKYPMYLSDIYGMTTTSLRADLAKLASQHNIGLIVVDYLNKLLDRDGGDDISNTKLKAQRMQSICREFGVSGILIQSMNKEGMRASVPTMADMSGPADAAHEGDNVFLMAKHPVEGGVIQLLPAKLRDGDTGKKPINIRWVEGLPKFANYVKTVSERDEPVLQYWHD